MAASGSRLPLLPVDVYLHTPMRGEEAGVATLAYTMVLALVPELTIVRVLWSAERLPTLVVGLESVTETGRLYDERS